jgi:hypothetical protein
VQDEQAVKTVPSDPMARAVGVDAAEATRISPVAVKAEQGIAKVAKLQAVFARSYALQTALLDAICV